MDPAQAGIKFLTSFTKHSKTCSTSTSTIIQSVFDHKLFFKRGKNLIPA
jgi:hypothetical protein